jgi:LDH2 family malate/lactate/ureidoglycolate dehydrogenase
VRPADFYEGGSLLPFGRHKGYALGLAVALLSGLSGEFDAERGTMEGAFLQAVNISAFLPLDRYQRAVRAALDGVKATQPVPGIDHVLAPGDPEQRARARRLAEGIDLPDRTYQEFREWAERLHVSLHDVALEASDVEPYRLPV